LLRAIDWKHPGFKVWNEQVLFGVIKQNGYQHILTCIWPAIPLATEAAVRKGSSIMSSSELPFLNFRLMISIGYLTHLRRKRSFFAYDEHDRIVSVKSTVALNLSTALSLANDMAKRNWTTWRAYLCRVAGNDEELEN
jgi:hypothetical protein